MKWKMACATCLWHKEYFGVNFCFLNNWALKGSGKFSYKCYVLPDLDYAVYLHFPWFKVALKDIVLKKDRELLVQEGFSAWQGWFVDEESIKDG